MGTAAATRNADHVSAGGNLLVTNIGTLLTGRVDNPIRVADSIWCAEGRLARIGLLDDVHPGGDPPRLDVAGATVCPGLIDPHVHPVFGDFTPRHSTLNWIDSYVHGGITTLISAGEPHLPGRPRTAAGSAALALLAHESFRVVRPSGAKVHAGAVLLEHGLEETDFRRLAEAGVWLMGEIGISSVRAVEDVVPLVAAARKYGFHIPVHVGGTSVPGSTTMGADEVVAIQPDVAVHCNGGPTAPSLADIERIIAETDAAIEVVQAGNIRALTEVVRLLLAAGQPGRLQIGSDTPSGTGVIPSGILRTMAYCAALAGLDPALAICAATGSTAATFGLDVGVITEGAPADLTVLAAPLGSQATTTLNALAIGDMPAVATVVIDGEVRVHTSRVTPPPLRASHWQR